MEEWDAFRDSHDLYSERRNKSKQGSRQEAANDRVWLVWGQRETEERDDSVKENLRLLLEWRGRDTAREMGSRKDYLCRVKKARPATYRPERSRGGNAGK